MLRYRTGTAGSAAGAIAAARYFLDETLQPENQELANYYGGESVPELQTGMDHLARAIANGDMLFDDAAAMLADAHHRMFGAPEDMFALDERIENDLLKVRSRASRPRSR